MPAPQPDPTRDLDHNGIVDALDDRSRDLDHDGIIDAEDRAVNDLNNDHIIDSTDRQLMNDASQTQKKVGTTMGWTKSGETWQPPENTNSQDQSQTLSAKVRTS